MAVRSHSKANGSQRRLKLSSRYSNQVEPWFSDVNKGIQGSFCCGFASNITAGVTTAIFPPVLPDNRVIGRKSFLERPLRWGDCNFAGREGWKL